MSGFRSFEVWLGRGLWMFLLILIVATKVMGHVTGVSPLSKYADSGTYMLMVAGISLTISAITMIFVRRP